MKSKFIFCLALVFCGVLFGCKSVSESSLDVQRQHLADVYRDKTRPMVERVAAFDDLLETIKDGTPRAVLDKYCGVDVTTGLATSIVRLDGDWWEVMLTAPDGSFRAIPLKGERFEDQVVTYK